MSTGRARWMRCLSWRSLIAMICRCWFVVLLSGRQFVLAGLRLKFRAGSSFTFDVRRGVVRAGVFCLGFAPQA